MVQHFVTLKHDPDAFKFAVLEIITPQADQGGDILNRLAQQETYWIHRLSTLHPTGLNTNINFAAYL